MQKLQGGFMVIARWMEKDVLKGFLLADTTYHLHMATIEAIQRNGYLIPYLNAQYDAQYQTLVGTNGASLSNYPAVNSDYVLLNGNGIIVVATVVDADTKKPLGVVAFNGMGTRFNLTYKTLNELVRKYPACNFDIKVDPKYGAIAVKKDGSYFDYVEIIKPQTQKGQPNSGNAQDCVSLSSSNAIPVMGVYNVEEMRTNEFNQPSQDKLVRTMLNMSKLTPYYYTVLTAIKRKPAPIGTMGVTEDTLYYDPKFVAELRVPELTFVLIHEIMHIAMQHSVRFGTRTNHPLWNIATDLYINSIICNDFGCVFGQGVVDFKSAGQIKTPDFGVYMETIGDKIDLATDTPETIYDRLLKENPAGQQGQQGQQSPQMGGQKSGQGQAGQQSGQQGQSQAEALIQEGMKEVREGAQRAQQQANNSPASQQANNQIEKGLQGVQDAVNDAKSNQQQSAGQKAQQGMQDTQQGVNDMNKATPSGGSPQGGMSPQEQMQRGMNKIQQGLTSMSQGGSGQGQSGQGQQSSGQMGGKQGGQGAGQGSQGQGQEAPGQDGVQSKDPSQGQGQQSNVGEDDFEGSGDYQSMQNVNVVYNGKKLTGTIMRDVMSSGDSTKKEDIQKRIDKSRGALQTIKTKIQLEEEERGESLEKNAGAGAGLTRRYIEVGLSAGVDWRVIFRNICKDKPKKTFTLAQPNQDYMNMGMTIADRRRIGKPERVSHVKFAVDVSGSVSKRELMVILSEINNIFKYYKLDGELIYWSTMIGDAGMFSNLKDMLKVAPDSTGGTDVRCVFDYLAGKTKVHGVTEKDRVRDMKAVFIITDGCFSMNFDDYADMFGKRVVWLITGVRGNTITFNPPFGRVLAIDIDND